MGTTAAVDVLHLYAVRCLLCNMYASSALRRHMLILEAVSSVKIDREWIVMKPYFPPEGVHKFTAKSEDSGVCRRYISKDPEASSTLGSAPLSSPFTSPASKRRCSPLAHITYHERSNQLAHRRGFSCSLFITLNLCSAGDIAYTIARRRCVSTATRRIKLHHHRHPSPTSR
jgi:hypothetical protein